MANKTLTRLQVKAILRELELSPDDSAALSHARKTLESAKRQYGSDDPRVMALESAIRNFKAGADR